MDTIVFRGIIGPAKNPDEHLPSEIQEILRSNRLEADRDRNSRHSRTEKYAALVLIGGALGFAIGLQVQGFDPESETHVVAMDDAVEPPPKTEEKPMESNDLIDKVIDQEFDGEIAI